jgi:hypothetical protein
MLAFAMVDRQSSGFLAWPQTLVGLLIVFSLYMTFENRDPIGYGAGPQWGHATKHGLTQVASQVVDRNIEQISSWLDEERLHITESIGVDHVPVSVRLLDNERAYDHFGQLFIRGFTPHMDFCYSPADRTIYGYWMREQGLRLRLRHELVNAVLHWTGRNAMPIWLEEGIGELAEGSRVNEDDDIDLSISHHFKLKRMQGKRLRQAGRAFRDTAPRDLLKDVGRKELLGRHGSLEAVS